MDAHEIERLKLKLDLTEKMMRTWLETVYFLYLGDTPRSDQSDEELIQALENRNQAKLG